MQSSFFFLAEKMNPCLNKIYIKYRQVTKTGRNQAWESNHTYIPVGKADNTLAVSLEDR